MINPNNDAPFTEGPLDAEIVLVGEAPGASEAAHGGAFIGPAGELLTQLMASAGINRSRCRLDNVFQFHPPCDNLDSFISFNSGGRARTTPEYDKHLELLRLRLAQTSSNIIVPLGNIAMFALTGLHGITKKRGSLVQSTLLPGRKCLPTIHPSASLRFGKVTRFLEGQRKKAVDPYVYRYWIVHDLQRALEQSKFREIRLPKRNLYTEPSFSDVVSWLRTASETPYIGFDIEATRGIDSEITCVAVSLSPVESLCIPFTSGTRDYWTPDQEAEVWIELSKVLEHKGTTKIIQNAAFDVGFLHRRRGVVVSPIEDTMIATSILYPEYPAGLDFLVSIYCSGEPYYKDEGKQWLKNPFGDESTFRIYNAKDAAVLPEIFFQQKEDLVRQGNLATYERQKKLVYPLVFAANRGIKMDMTRLDSIRADCDRAIDDVSAKWAFACKVTGVNPDSAQQVMQYFYGSLGERPYTNDGKTTCDERALQRMAARGIEEAEILLRYRKLTKLRNTYFEMQFDEDGRVRCSYNPVGTEQGRISSSKNIFGTGGNLQNMPPEMRELMRAD